jgi:hypothetical protein
MLEEGENAVNSVAMRYTADNAAVNRPLGTQLHVGVNVPHVIVNAPVHEVYRTLTGKELGEAQALEMYFSPAHVRRAYALLGAKVYASYSLYAVPGGCQISARILAPARNYASRATRRATRMAGRQVESELARLRDGLE